MSMKDQGAGSLRTCSKPWLDRKLKLDHPRTRTSYPSDLTSEDEVSTDGEGSFPESISYPEEWLEWEEFVSQTGRTKLGDIGETKTCVWGISMHCRISQWSKIPIQDQQRKDSRSFNAMYQHGRKWWTSQQGHRATTTISSSGFQTCFLERKC